MDEILSALSEFALTHYFLIPERNETRKGIRETIRAELRSRIVEYVKGSSEQVSSICLDKIFVDDLAINSLKYDFL